MATYTMQLRVIIERYTQHLEGLSWSERIEEGRKYLFDFDYPIFDENYRNVLETNFIRKFYMREIGFETEGLFKFQLQTWLQINMPYFNNLFESECIKFDPLINAKMTTKHEKLNEKDQIDDRTIAQQSETEGKIDSDMTQDSVNKSKTDGKQDTTNKSKTDSNQDSKSKTKEDDENFKRDIHSDTPDTRLRLTTQDGSGILEYASRIEEEKQNGKHNSETDGNTKQTSNTDSTSKTDTTSDTNSTSKTDTTSTDKSKVESSTDRADNLKSNVDEREEFIETRVGKIGITSQSQLLMEYRQSLIRVEVMLHREMQELFMMLL